MLHFNEHHIVPDLIRNTMKYLHAPEDTFMLVKRSDVYQPISYGETMEQVGCISAFFVEHGIKKGDGLALIIENSPEYVFYDQALQQIGAINVSIYPTISEHDIEYILNDSRAKAILVGSHFLLKKILKVSKHCPELKFIIPAFDDYKKWISDTATTEINICSLNEVIASGKKSFSQYEARIEEMRSQVKPEDLSALIYTSGTTGTPKGVMLTHRNFVCNVKACLEHIPVINSKEVFLSFLPLSHVFERTATYHVCLAKGCTIAFAQSLELLGKNMMEVKPTVMNAVPRLLERIHDRAMKSGTEKGGLKTKIFLWAIQVGNDCRKTKEKGKALNPLQMIQLAIAEQLVFKKIKEKTGGRIKFILSGGAALPQNVGEFFGNLGIKVMEGFGLTETSPVVAVNEYHRQVYGTVGRVIPGVTIGIQHPETLEIIASQTHESYDPSFECAEGEIIVKGHCVMKAYWNQPEETARVIDPEGWFHTGDIGKFQQGCLKITDRIKNILVNSFGKNVYPTPIENIYLKSHKIEQLFLVGDKREYITAIIVPSKEMLMETFGLKEDFFQESDPFIHDKKMIDWIKEDIRTLSTELGKFERIKNFCLKRTAFSIDAGELTPTLKTKRKVIEQKYADKINELYEDHHTHL